MKMYNVGRDSSCGAARLALALAFGATACAKPLRDPCLTAARPRLAAAFAAPQFQPRRLAVRGRAAAAATSPDVNQAPCELKVLLFDLDGTLSDSDPLHYRSYATALEEHGYSARLGERFYYEELTGRPNPSIMAQLCPSWSEERKASVVARKEALYAAGAHSLEARPGLGRVFDWARQHSVRVMLVTNTSPAEAAMTLAVIGLAHEFPDAVTDRVYGCECAAMKPAPDPYLEAVARLGVAPEACIAFEDSPTGWLSATTAGIPTIRVGATAPTLFEDVCLPCGITDFADQGLADHLASRVAGKVPVPGQCRVCHSFDEIGGGARVPELVPRGGGGRYTGRF